MTVVLSFMLDPSRVLSFDRAQAVVGREDLDRLPAAGASAPKKTMVLAV